MWTWTVNDFEAGRPLPEAIALRIPAVPPGLLRQLLRKGRVRCDETPVSDDMIVAAGMTVAIRASARLDALIAANGIPPAAVLFEDRHTLVVDKPAGLAMHQAGALTDHLQARVARFLAWRHAPFRAAPVHRLDIGTSGAVLFGKGRLATGQYGRLLMAGGFTKLYLALVAGAVPAAGELTTPVPDGDRYREALTRFRCLSRQGDHCLLELTLVTGRTHQARRQLADAGWPIVGDRRYGGEHRPGLTHPWLHCRQLSFPELDGGTLRTVTAPLPDDLAETLSATFCDFS